VEKLVRLKWPIVLTVIGVGMTACAAIWIYRSFTDPGISIRVPGETTFTIIKPGNYSLWSEVSASFDGQLRTFPTGLPPGVEIKITRRPGGTVVPVQSKLPTTRQNGDGVIRVIVGTVRFETPGDYQIATTGLQEKRALRLDQFQTSDLFLMIFLALAGQPLIVAGLGWGLFILFSSRGIPRSTTTDRPPPIPVA